MDEAVGKVLKQIDASGVAENTIVIFTSDNGGLSTSEGSPTSNLPLRGGKGSLYEGGVRIPMVWSFPGRLPAGVSEPRPVSSLDISATALDQLNIARPPQSFQYLNSACYC